jgi:hypothetical protein
MRKRSNEQEPRFGGVFSCGDKRQNNLSLTDKKMAPPERDQEECFQ